MSGAADGQQAMNEQQEGRNERRTSAGSYSRDLISRTIASITWGNFSMDRFTAASTAKPVMNPAQNFLEKLSNQKDRRR